MESPNGSGSDTKPQNHQLEKKRLNRAPSPARPFLKDVHSRSAKPPAIVPKSPKLNKQQQSAILPSLAHPNRNSRRNATGSKEKLAAAKSHAKSSVAKKPLKVPQHAAAEPKAASIKPDSTSSPVLAKSKRGKLASGSPGPPSHGSPIRVPTGAPLGRVSQTDSSSDLSDCPSEPLSDEQRLAPAASSDAESGTGSSDRDQLGADNPLRAEATGAAADAPLRTTEAPSAKGSMSQAQPAPGAHGEKHKQEKPSSSAQFRLPGTKDVTEEDLLREVEDLRSENDYLKVRPCHLKHGTVVFYYAYLLPDNQFKTTFKKHCILKIFSRLFQSLTQKQLFPQTELGPVSSQDSPTVSPQHHLFFFFFLKCP